MNCAVLGLVLWLSGALIRAGTMEVSFLDDAAAVRDTNEVLRGQGCRPEAILAFRKALLRYYQHPLELDRSRFPSPTLGFYSFGSASQLVGALTNRLCDATHPFELNCYDNVILLTKDLLHVRLQPDELNGPFLPALVWTNNLVYRNVAATARDAFSFSYPAWYMALTADIMGALTNETRMCITTGFYCFHVLPGWVSEADLGGCVLKVLKRDWEKVGLSFPTQMEIVLCHQVCAATREALTEHAGLLFHDHEHYVYIEKAGGSGPFVRLDFTDLADLRTWLAAQHTSGANAAPHHQYFVTFNDQRIEALSIPSD
jgi:hypothetical protein